MSDRTARLVARLRARLAQATRRMTWAEVAFGAVVAGGSIAGIWFLAALLEASLWLGTTARTALAAAVFTTAVGTIAAFLTRPLGQLAGLWPRPSEERMARTVGERHPALDDQLVNLLQLADGHRSHAPAPFIDRAVQHLAGELEGVSFEELEDFDRARRALRLASLPVAGVLTFLLVAPATFLGASERLLAPTTPFERPAPFELSVTPGDTRLVRGDSLFVTVQSTGQAPTTATLLLRQGEQPPERIPLSPDSFGTIRHIVPNVRQDLQYRIAAPPVETAWYDVEVLQRPLVRQLQVQVRPPSYADRPARTLDPNVGDIEALPGSQVRLTATLGGPTVKVGRVAFEDGDSVPLNMQADTATASFPVQRDGTYRLHLQGQNGTTNRAPIRYQIALQTDARPSATFEAPPPTTDLSPDLVQPLRVRMSDDYGLRRARLYYRTTATDTAAFSSIPLPLSAPGTDHRLTYEWLLAQDSGLDPEPGETVEYYVRVWDNDTVNGPKSGRTQTQRLRRPSKAEQYQRLDSTKAETSDQLDRLRQQSDSVRQQFEQLRRDLRRTREVDWQNQRQLQSLQQSQSSMQKRAQQLSQKMQQLNRQMQRNGLSSQQTAQKFQELQKLAERMQSTELQKALEQLKQAMKSGDPRQMQQALEQARRSEQQYRDQLERTRELFKQLKARQSLDEMKDRAQSLSALQDSLAAKTSERMKSESPDDTSAPNSSSPNTKDRPPSPDSSASPSRPTSPSDSAGTPRQRPTPDSTRQSGRSPSNEDLARQQEQAAQQMKDLMERIRQAQKEMENTSSAPKKQLQKLREQMQSKQLPKQMQQNSRQLQRNQLQKARQGQRQMQQSLQQMQKQLNQMGQQMQGSQRKLNTAGLRNALENTLRLSRRQEALRHEVDDLSGEGPVLRTYARRQNSLSQGLETVADSLQSIARRLPELSQRVQTTTGNALRAMDDATTALDKRNVSQASSQQRGSMRHLNELALLLSDLLDSLNQSSGSGQSMQQALQQMKQSAGQQQKLNQQLQQFLNNMQGERLSPQQQKRQKQLARQQRKIKNQIQDLNLDAQAEQQLMGNLQKIADQMEQSAQELEAGERRDLMERQQQILTRLLNAQKSLRTQGKQDERQGQRAEDVPERTAPGGRPSQSIETLRRDLIRALEMGYSSDYEELIRRYFDLLQRRDENAPQP